MPTADPFRFDTLKSLSESAGKLIVNFAHVVPCSATVPQALSYLWRSDSLIHTFDQFKDAVIAQNIPFAKECLEELKLCADCFDFENAPIHTNLASVDIAEESFYAWLGEPYQSALKTHAFNHAQAPLELFRTLLDESLTQWVQSEKAEGRIPPETAYEDAVIYDIEASDIVEEVYRAAVTLAFLTPREKSIAAALQYLRNASAFSSHYEQPFSMNNSFIAALSNDNTAQAAAEKAVMEGILINCMSHCTDWRETERAAYQQLFPKQFNLTAAYIRWETFFGELTFTDLARDIIRFNLADAYNAAYTKNI